MKYTEEQIANFGQLVFDIGHAKYGMASNEDELIVVEFGGKKVLSTTDPDAFTEFIKEIL